MSKKSQTITDVQQLIHPAGPVALLDSGTGAELVSRQIIRLKTSLAARRETRPSPISSSIAWKRGAMNSGTVRFILFLSLAIILLALLAAPSPLTASMAVVVTVTPVAPFVPAYPSTFVVQAGLS